MTGPPTAAEMLAPVSSWSDLDPDGAPGPSGRSGRGRETRRSLLRAAAQEFDACGYHEASLRRITDVAAVTKGALYFHFRSKQHMTEALVAEMDDSWLRVAATVRARRLDPLWTLLVESDAVVGRWMHDVVVRGASRALAERPDLASTTGRRMLRDWEAHTEELLVRGARDGLLRDGVDPSSTARVLLAVSAGHRWFTEAVPDERSYWQRMTDALRHMMLLIADDEWQRSWLASGWATRPDPDPDAYARARRASPPPPPRL